MADAVYHDSRLVALNMAAPELLGQRLYDASYAGRTDGPVGVHALLAAEGTPLEWRHPDWGSTPLHRAASCGHAGVVAALLEAGANPLSIARDGRTPLHEAARKGHAACVRALLGCPGMPIRDMLLARGEGGLTPLHCAVSVRTSSTAQLLLPAPVPAAVAGPPATSAARVVATDGEDSRRDAIAQARLSNGAEGKGAESDGDVETNNVMATVLDSGALSSPSPSPSPMCVATVPSEAPEVVVIRALLEADAELHCQHGAADDLGRSAAHAAAAAGRADALSLLIDDGHPADDPDSHGAFTPLHMCAQAGHEACVRVLVDKLGGEPLERRTESGDTPFTLCAHGAERAMLSTQEFVECLVALAELGANVWAKDGAGLTGLDIVQPALRPQEWTDVCRELVLPVHRRVVLAVYERSLALRRLRVSSHRDGSRSVEARSSPAGAAGEGGHAEVGDNARREEDCDDSHGGGDGVNAEHACGATWRDPAFAGPHLVFGSLPIDVMGEVLSLV